VLDRIVQESEIRPAGAALRRAFVVKVEHFCEPGDLEQATLYWLHSTNRERCVVFVGVSHGFGDHGDTA